MPRVDVEVRTPDGQSPGTLHLPPGDGPWPGVLMFPDAGGVRETFHTMADHLAGLGYATLLPDVYYREAGWAPFDMRTAFADKRERGRILGIARSLTRNRIIADSGAFVEFLLARPEVTGSAVGTTGYCMGGRMSLIAAGAHPDRIAATASFHGGRLAVADDPDSPHLAADRITATVYIAGAVADATFTTDQAKLLDAALTEAGVTHKLEIYPARHGFAVSDNPTHDPEAEARHWRALAELYGATLPGAGGG
jgi:carboxymethylenebutenolidase